MISRSTAEQKESNTSKSVVIFGGAGYTGSSISKQFLSKGYKVCIFDNFIHGDSALKDPLLSKAEIINADISDTREVVKAIRGKEVVILAASINSVENSLVDNKDVRNVNLIASSAVLDVASEYGAERFILSSTAEVYGDISGAVYETTVPEPPNLYARLKLRLEERVLAASSRDFCTTCLRLGSCFGVSPKMRFDLLFNRMVRNACVNRNIKLESLDTRLPFIHIDDASRSFVNCVEAHQSLVKQEIFNISAQDSTVSLNYLVNLIMVEIPDISVDLKLEECLNNDFSLNSVKAKKILGFNAKWTLEQGIKEIKKYVEKNKNLDFYSREFVNII